jgi:hypothetical protein
MGAKSQNFIAMAILASIATLGWSAEAALPKYKLINASRYITIQKIRNIDGSINCFAFNQSRQNICAAFDAYPVWPFVHPVRGTVWRSLPGKKELNCLDISYPKAIGAVQTNFGQIPVFVRAVPVAKH